MFPQTASSSLDQATGILHGLPLDWIILVVFALIVAVDAFRSGTRRAAVFCIAAPLALFIYFALPSPALIASSLANLSEPLQAAVFGVVFVAIYILTYRIIPASFDRGSFIVQAVVATISALALLIIVWSKVPALSALLPLSPTLQTIFGSSYTVFWLLGVYIALACVRK